MSLPDCPSGTPEACRFSQGPTSSTLAYYPPALDREGRNHNPDRNTTSSQMTCVTCGHKWTDGILSEEKA